MPPSPQQHVYQDHRHMRRTTVATFLCCFVFIILLRFAAAANTTNNTPPPLTGPLLLETSVPTFIDDSFISVLPSRQINMSEPASYLDYHIRPVVAANTSWIVSNRRLRSLTTNVYAPAQLPYLIDSTTSTCGQPELGTKILPGNPLDVMYVVCSPNYVIIVEANPLTGFYTIRRRITVISNVILPKQPSNQQYVPLLERNIAVLQRNSTVDWLIVSGSGAVFTFDAWNGIQVRPQYGPLVNSRIFDQTQVVMHRPSQTLYGAVLIFDRQTQYFLFRMDDPSSFKINAPWNFTTIYSSSSASKADYMRPPIVSNTGTIYFILQNVVPPVTSLQQAYTNPTTIFECDGSNLIGTPFVNQAIVNEFPSVYDQYYLHTIIDSPRPNINSTTKPYILPGTTTLQQSYLDSVSTSDFSHYPYQFWKEGFSRSINLDHDTKLQGATLFLDDLQDALYFIKTHSIAVLKFSDFINDPPLFVYLWSFDYSQQQKLENLGEIFYPQIPEWVTSSVFVTLPHPDDVSNRVSVSTGGDGSNDTMITTALLIFSRQPSRIYPDQNAWTYGLQRLWSIEAPQCEELTLSMPDNTSISSTISTCVDCILASGTLTARTCQYTQQSRCVTSVLRDDVPICEALPPLPSSSEKMSTHVLIGLGGLTVLLVIGFLIVFFYRRYARRRALEASLGETSPPLSAGVQIEGQPQEAQQMIEVEGVELEGVPHYLQNHLPLHQRDFLEPGEVEQFEPGVVN